MLSQYSAKHLDEFFAGIASWDVAYKQAGLSYFAIQHEGAFLLTQARLFLRAGPSPVPATHFQSNNIRAGYYPLAELDGTPRVIVERLTSGTLQTPHGELLFPPESNGHHSATYTPFHQEGLQAGNRLDVLLLTGIQRIQRQREPYYDWEVKAAPTPYDNVNEPPRVLRRLQLLREWSHEQIKQVFA